MMPEGKQTNLAFMSTMILSCADVRNVSMLQLHVIKEGKLMKDVGRSIVFKFCTRKQEILSDMRRIVTQGHYSVHSAEKNKPWTFCRDDKIILKLHHNDRSTVKLQKINVPTPAEFIKLTINLILNSAKHYITI